MFLGLKYFRNIRPRTGLPRPNILDLGTRLRFALMFNDTVPCSWSGKLSIVPTCQ